MIQDRACENCGRRIPIDVGVLCYECSYKELEELREKLVHRVMSFWERQTIRWLVRQVVRKMSREELNDALEKGADR